MLGPILFNIFLSDFFLVNDVNAVQDGGRGAKKALPASVSSVTSANVGIRLQES